MRVPGRGLHIGAPAVSFTFDGKQYQGVEGDTLASALLANGVRFVARSFKYHRPRGIMTAGSEEPNALVTIGSGAQTDPNIRATTQEIYEGLEAQSQNNWPSLRTDILAINDLASPFLGAGFYYKTFMWPRAFWERVYEPIIRRAAGLGALSGAHNTDTYEKAFAFCELLIIGAGPAGLMAALSAGRAGVDVILVDEDARMGGRLLAESEAIDGLPAAEWVAKMLTELKTMPSVRLMSRTTVTGVYDQGTFGALERVSHHHARRDDLARECFWRIVAQRSILCAGALERPIAFANNDRPGIMTAGAVRTYLNRWGVAPGNAITIFTNNDDAYRTAHDLAEAGVKIAGVLDARPDGDMQGDFPIFRGARITGTRGRRGLRSISFEHDGGIGDLETDCLGMSGGWNPTLHLTCHLGGRPDWNESLQSFVPRADMVPDMVVAGAANGTFSTAACLKEGADLGIKAAKALGKKPRKITQPVSDDAPYTLTPLWVVEEGKGRKWIDFQNDVHVKDIALAVQENFTSVEHMKRYTTQGMAPDQGKNSNVNALAILADVTGRDIPSTGTTTFRPPFSPVPIAALGAGAQGKGFAPERLMTSHQTTLDRGAHMIEAGLWYRPLYFPRHGEKTMRESSMREAKMVREHVGIFDVSTLGKIDVQGPDAGEFLDFVYTNMMSTLRVGRVRYGLMLREDGHVMDDGTAARLSADHYVLTTTTGGAGLVMRHLDFVAQALRPDLDVRIISVTEQWAQFALAGPKSFELLNDLLDTPLAADEFPFMACGEVTLSGIGARLFRISFSGEHAYELAVPSRYGASLFRLLLAQAESMGGGAYGIEAMDVLRIEKGFITHAEIHGRTTAYDIGFGGLVSGKKDCIGKTLAGREGLMDSTRERLVGLRPIDPKDQLSSGAFLFNEGADPVREQAQGYLTSACWSPNMDTYLALGFLQSGPDRMGETVRMVDHLQGLDCLAEVVHPVFFDPEGGRVRG